MSDFIPGRYTQSELGREGQDVDNGMGTSATSEEISLLVQQNGGYEDDQGAAYGSTADPMHTDDELFGESGDDEDEDPEESRVDIYTSTTITSSNRSSTTKGSPAPNTTLSTFTIVSILSTAFSYGCIFSTLFLITLPVECERIHQEHETVPKSVSLGAFVAIAGVTQLISPLVGRLSDLYEPPVEHELGQRLPFLILGAVCTIVGLLGQMLASYGGFWLRYGAFFFLHMLGLNIMYAMMLALIPDQVPASQTGVANGILALELVMGSLFGFGLFYIFFYDYVQSMYSLYVINIIVTTIATGTHAHDRDAALAQQRRSTQQRHRRQQERAMFLAAQQALLQQDPASSSSLVPTNTPRQSPVSSNSKNRRRLRRRWHRAAKKAAHQAGQVLVMTPTRILKSMLLDTFATLDWSAVLQCYTIDVNQYRDFAVVTVSRLFYYSGMSIQTFFLYYVHDVLHITQDPQGVVAALAILGQCSAALTCYPVGVWSDRYGHGERRPLVYLACAVLCVVSVSLIWIRTLHEMTVAVFLLGCANGIYLTMDTSLAVDTLPDHVDDSAQLLGVWGVAAFLGSALGPMIGGPLLYTFGQNQESDYDATTSNTDDTSNDDEFATESYGWHGYIVVLSLGGLYFLISALTVLVFLDGSDSKNTTTSPNHAAPSPSPMTSTVTTKTNSGRTQDDNKRQQGGK